jgi:hypothetical protein
MQTFFKKFGIVKISREQNKEANLLARMGSATLEDTDEKTDVPIQTLTQPTIDKNTTILTLKVVPLQAEELVRYLREDILPIDKKAAVKLKARATQFTLVNETLYKRGFMLPLLKCVLKEEGEYILWEIHEGVCGNYFGARVLAHKVVRASSIGRT